MIPVTRNGLAWFRTKGYRKVLLGSLGVVTGHQCASKFDMGLYRACPQTKRVRHVRVTRHFHFFPRQGQAMESACGSAQNLSFDEAAQATSKKNQNRCFAQDTRVRLCIVLCHVLEESSGMDTDGRELVCSKSSHQRSQSRFVWRVLVRKAQTNTKEQRQVEISNRSGQTAMGLQTGQGIQVDGKVCYVKSTWPGCEVKQVRALSL